MNSLIVSVELIKISCTASDIFVSSLIFECRKIAAVLTVFLILQVNFI